MTPPNQSKKRTGEKIINHIVSKEIAAGKYDDQN